MQAEVFQGTHRPPSGGSVCSRTVPGPDAHDMDRCAAHIDHRMIVVVEMVLLVLPGELFGPTRRPTRADARGPYRQPTFLV